MQTKAAAAATSLPMSNEHVDGWIYLGLEVNGKWLPPARGVSPVGDPLATTNIKTVGVTSDTPLLASIDFDKGDISELAAGRKQPIQFVSADTTLQLQEEPVPQPTIGSGRLVWAHVKVPSERVKQVGGR